MESYIDKKFYVPEIEEFHVGFEYEYIGYGECVFSNDMSISFMDYLIDNGRIRVKRLDREDIESLGFYIPQGGLDYVYKKSVGEIDYILITNPNYPNKIEIRCSHPSWAYGSFLGIIKNKSQLKRILKQIGI